MVGFQAFKQRLHAFQKKPGAGGGSPAGPILLDNFNDNSKGALWGTDGNFNDAFGAAVGTVAETGGATVITPATGASGYTGRISANAADFVGKYLIFERKTTISGSNESMVKVGQSSAQGYGYYTSGSQIYFFKWDFNNARSTIGNMTDPDFADNNQAPTSLLFFRLWHDAANDAMKLDGGATENGSWTNLFSQARDDNCWNKNATPALKFALVGGQWGSSSSPGSIIYDNVYSDAAY